MSGQMNWAQRWNINDDGEMVMSDSGSWVEYAYYAYLKADVVELADALKLASEVGIKVADEVTRLKAENEEIHADYEALANEHTKLTERHKALRLEAERLRKAGDDMYTTLVDNSRHFEEVWRDRRIFAREAFQGWNHAKEGKPSV